MRTNRWLLWRLALVAGVGFAASHADAQPPTAAHGKALFQSRCGMCHAGAPDDGDGGVGPSLKGVVGRRAAVAPGYAYTAALRGSGLVWTRPNLDRFLSGPGKMVPGTAMPIAIPSPKDRADIIGYLATVK